MTQQTSLQAYYNFKGEGKLGQLQRDVYMTLKLNGGLTNSEIAKILNRQINVIVPRTYELREMGIVIPNQRRHCRITGKTVIEWKCIEKIVNEYDRR